jgi:hypothetical protein
MLAAAVVVVILLEQQPQEADAVAMPVQVQME